MIALSSPNRTPSCGSSPYAPEPITPEISTTPPNTIGTATSERFSGRSPSAAQAISATKTTCTLPSTVDSPAPTASMAWCQKVRLAANSTPASQPSRWSRRERPPKRSRSRQASRPNSGSA